VLETRETATESDQPESLQPEYQCLWSPRYIDAAVLRDANTDADGTCDDERIYYLGDANFNVTTLVDTDGDAIERYLYEPYGVLTVMDGSFASRSASSYDNPYTFTGRRLDAETGLYYYRHRFLTAELGRFVSRDLIGYQDGLALYVFVHNNPLNSRDPLGQQTSNQNGECDCDVQKMIDVRDRVQWGILFMGYFAGADGFAGNALAHCVVACKLHQRMPECDDVWEKSEKTVTGRPRDDYSDLDLRNNAVGRGIVGDCYDGCERALFNGDLWCMGSRGAVHCQASTSFPRELPSIWPPPL
jgi:RHS repeat-associated protein